MSNFAKKKQVSKFVPNAGRVFISRFRRFSLFFFGNKTFDQHFGSKKHFLLNLTPNLFLVLHFFQLYSAKNAENEDFDSVLGAQHPNACGNIQHQCQVPVSTTPIFVG